MWVRGEREKEKREISLNAIQNMLNEQLLCALNFVIFSGKNERLLKEIMYLCTYIISINATYINNLINSKQMSF